LVAAAMVPGSELLLHNVGLNDTRDGIVRVLQAMGADLRILNPRLFGSEPVADIRVYYRSGLEGIDIPEDWVPSLIDELPVIMALAAVAAGTTRIRGAAELRVKESDRLAVMALGLTTLGVRLTEFDDGIDITGGIPAGGEVDGAGDHRCAMSFAVLGQVASEPVVVKGARNIDTSYPEFPAHFKVIGGNLEVQS
jgi:3-phosphoshikimate 1-carboxyvinyltransferase